jgi:hypothetical protein
MASRHLDTKETNVENKNITLEGVSTHAGSASRHCVSPAPKCSPADIVWSCVYPPTLS